MAWDDDLSKKLDRMLEDMDKSMDSGMSTLDRGMNRMDRAMERMDKKLRKGRSKLRGNISVGKGSKIIIDGVDVTDRYRERKSPVEKSQVEIIIDMTSKIVRAGVVIGILIFVISVAGMFFKMITEAEHKPKTLDNNPPAVTEQLDKEGAAEPTSEKKL